VATTSLHALRVGLFEEHLEEASFLHAQRCSMRGDPGGSWLRTAAFERRLDLHLDALVVGGDLALQVCRERACSSDAGELHAAASVFCRQRRADLLSELLHRLDFDDIDRVQAVSEALRSELPQDWTPFIAKALARADSRLLPVLAAAVGYRRLPVGRLLAEAMERGPAHPMAIIDALGRLRERRAESCLRRMLDDAEPRVRAAALIALLRCGFDEPLSARYLLAQREDWPQLALGLGGDRSAAHVLIQAVTSGRAGVPGLLALGLLGLPGSLRCLFECLAQPALAAAAAQAMNWICGADLYDDVFVAEAIDEDELFQRELKAWRQYREVPRAANGQPFGSSKTTLSVDPDRWKAWFTDNLRRFDAAMRYRRGRLYSPLTLVADLRHPDTDGRLRELTAHELVIRFDCDIPFEVDMSVCEQLQALDRMTDWADAHADDFPPGRWHFSGQPQGELSAVSQSSR
jgi:hypothetical protein